MKPIARLPAALALLLGSYGAAGLVGGAIPANAAWHAPSERDAGAVAIWIEDNGIHTGIVLPKQAAGVDLRGFSPAADLADARFAGHRYLAIGWGERRFFLDTPTWADVRPATVLAAAIGSDATLLHVEHVARPVAGAHVRRVLLRAEEYRRLVAFVRAARVEGGTRHPGYAGYDAFYEARGHYDAVRTCNWWTGAALRSAGVRVGAWTPFPVTVMGWF